MAWGVVSNHAKPRVNQRVVPKRQMESQNGPPPDFVRQGQHPPGAVWSRQPPKPRIMGLFRVFMGPVKRPQLSVAFYLAPQELRPSETRLRKASLDFLPLRPQESTQKPKKRTQKTHNANVAAAGRANWVREIRAACRNFAGILRRESAPNQHRRALFRVTISPRHSGHPKPYQKYTGFACFHSSWCCRRMQIQAATTPGQLRAAFRFAARATGGGRFVRVRLGLLGRIRQHASTMRWAGLRRTFCRRTQIVQTAVKLGRRVGRTLIFPTSA